MTKTKGILLLILYLTFLTMLSISCSGGGGSSSDQDVPKKIEIHNPKALFTAISQSSVSKSSSNSSSRLFELLDNGMVQTVIFNDIDGNQINVTVKNIINFNDKYAGLIFTCDYTEYKVIAELTTGTLLDFSEYNLDGAQITGDILFAHNYSSTLYRINLSTRTAEAVNNPKYSPIYDSRNYRTTFGTSSNINKQVSFLFDKNKNILALTTDQKQYVFFENNNPPYDTLKIGQRLSFDGIPTGAGYSSVFNGPDGSLYIVWRRQEALRKLFCSKMTFLSSEITTQETELATTDAGFIPHRNFYSVQTYDRFIPTSSGYIKTYADINNNMVYDYISKNMSAIPHYTGSNYREYPLISGDYIYWKDGNSVRRLEFSPGSSEETMVSTTNLIYFEVANGVVLFTRFITGTEIGTYKVTDPGTEPVLIESSDMEIKNIVEF